MCQWHMLSMEAAVSETVECETPGDLSTNIAGYERH